MIVGVRHAEVLNPDGIVYGRLPGYGLSERGRREAGALAAALSGRPVRAVVASPQQRASETAAILAEPHGLRVLTDERLAEWAFWAHWEGMAWTRIHDRDPELLEAYAEDPAAVTLGEPLADVAARVLAWAAEAEKADPNGLVLGVTHETPLLAALLVGSGRSLSAYHSGNLAHLATVRLRPGPAEAVDLAPWAARRQGAMPT